jgi:mRNA interferase RelE/StbE
MDYQVEIAPAAQRQIKKLPQPIQERILQRLERLAIDPRSEGVVKLSGAEDLYRIRVGDYRIIYAIEDQALLVLIVKVGHRRDVYR